MALRTLYVTVAVVLTMSSSVLAQATTPNEPERRIPFFAGDWTFAGKMNGVTFAPDQSDN